MPNGKKYIRNAKVGGIEVFAIKFTIFFYLTCVVYSLFQLSVLGAEGHKYFAVIINVEGQAFTFWNVVWMLTIGFFSIWAARRLYLFLKIVELLPGKIEVIYHDADEELPDDLARLKKDVTQIRNKYEAKDEQELP